MDYSNFLQLMFFYYELNAQKEKGAKIDHFIEEADEGIKTVLRELMEGKRRIVFA